MPLNIVDRPEAADDSDIEVLTVPLVLFGPSVPPVLIFPPYEGPDFEPARERRKAAPPFPGAALRAGIYGEVHLEIVIMRDGTVGTARIVKSPDRGDAAGLNDAALLAARYFLFEPATLNGEAVAIRATLVIGFLPSRPSRRN